FAPGALVIEMLHDAGDRILLVGTPGAAVEAAGIDAMVTRRRDRLLERPAPIVAHQRAGFAPGLAVVQPIERMTRSDAGLATAALVEIDLEGVLLAGCGRRGGDQLFVVWLADFVTVVRAGKFFDGGEFAL